MRGINHHEDFGWAAALRGGKGGKGAPPQLQVDSATDPETGHVFTSTPVNVMRGEVKPAAQQLQEFQDARRAQQQTQSQQDQAAAAAKSAQEETDFTGRRQSAYDQAMQDAVRSFTNAGVDPQNYMANYIQPALQKRLASVQDKDPNPMATLDPEGLGASIVQQALGDRRGQVTNALNSVFTPNYANTALPDTIASPFEAQILNEQFDPLVQSLHNAQVRGQLNDVGYQGAMDALNQKKSAAQSQIHSLGQNILSQDRSGLNDLVSGARTDVNNMNLGSSVDPTTYWNQAASKAADYTSGFGGALRSAVGNTQFADLTDLLNAGGMRQGATNSPMAAQTTGALTGDMTSTEDPTKKRGLGSTGAF